MLMKKISHRIFTPIFIFFRLEGQQEDCQNKYGCRISFQDVEFIPKQDQNNFNHLSKVIIIEQGCKCRVLDIYKITSKLI